MIINLSYAMHKGMFKYPSDPEIEIEITKAKFIKERYKSGNATLKLRNHHGTHIDAPAHKLPNGKTIDKYNLETFINNCSLIDFSSTNLMQRKQKAITKSDIKKCFNKDIYKKTKSLILYTGFCEEMALYEGKLSGKNKQEFEKTFPYLTSEVAEYLISENSDLNLLGIDSFSFDPSGSNSEVHRVFFKNNILLLETLVNLKKLNNIKTKLFELYSVPLIYEKTDAAQTTAYAKLK